MKPTALRKGETVFYQEKNSRPVAKRFLRRVPRSPGQPAGCMFEGSYGEEFLSDALVVRRIHRQCQVDHAGR